MRTTLLTVAPSIVGAAILSRPDRVSTASASPAASGVTSPAVTPRTWRYGGCFADSVANRTLSLDSFYSDSMTPHACINYCDGKGYTVAGLEYYSECYCDFDIEKDESRNENDCNMPCKGNKNTICGGSDRLSVWKSNKPDPITNPGVMGYGFLGCFADEVSARTLSHLISVDGDFTVQKCIAAGKAAGYSLVGAEYAGECWADNALNGGVTASVAGRVFDSGCDLPCKGNHSEFCGGSDKIDVYKAGYQSVPASSGNPAPWSTGPWYSNSPWEPSKPWTSSIPLTSKHPILSASDVVSSAGSPSSPATPTVPPYEHGPGSNSAFMPPTNTKGGPVRNTQPPF